MPACHLTVERISDEKTIADEWYPLLELIFPDPEDRVSLDDVLERVREQGNNLFFFLFRDEAKNEPVGIELRLIEPDLPHAVYGPYGGLIGEYRNRSLFFPLHKKCDEYFKEQAYLLFEVEDPMRIQEAFPNDKEARSTADNRIGFWKHAGCIIIRPDLENPDEKLAKYVRPASSDVRETQDYDLMALRILDPNNEFIKRSFITTSDGIITHISKDAYRRFYIEMIKIQYGNDNDETLRRDFPAVDAFLNNIDRCPLKWLKAESCDDCVNR